MKTELAHKKRRDVSLPKKLRDLITLVEANDYTSFRDRVLYDQFVDENDASTSWPDLLFGGDEKDVIRIGIYTNDNSFVETKYLTHNDINSASPIANYSRHSFTQVNPGLLLRNAGFRRGRFKLKFDFFRLRAGGPFSLLTTKDDKIFIGDFIDTGYNILADQEHVDSGTSIGDKLYVKPNKYIIQEISGDRSEAIISPAFIDNDGYKEDLRLAGYNCINKFPDEGDDVKFLPPGGGLINRMLFNSEASVTKLFINGTIRIKDAYWMGTREIPEQRQEIVIDPEVEAIDTAVNLLRGKTLDTTAGWKAHLPWPSIDAVNLSGDPDMIAACRFEDVVEPNPVGQFAIKQTIQASLNNIEGRSLSSIVGTNYSVGMYPFHEVGSVNGSFTLSVYAKPGSNVPEGAKVKLLVHSGPWGVEGSTAQSNWFLLSSTDWTRVHFTFGLTAVDLQSSLTCRCIFGGIEELNSTEPSSWYNSTLNTSIVGTEIYWTGAMLERSSVLNDFTRNMSQVESITEKAVSGIIKYEEPDGTLVKAIFPTVEDNFIEKMVGGIITIKNGLALRDNSNVSVTSDIGTEKIFDIGAITPVFSAEGVPGGYNPGWDISLHGQAIKVQSEDGIEEWTAGYNSHGGPDAKWSYAGTAQVGYHAQWVKDRGVDGGPCMYFPDYNYQDYIIDPMRQAASASWSSPTGYHKSRGSTDPRWNAYMSDAWPHRSLKIMTAWNTIGSLASYGVRYGDTIRVTWTQKSTPINFDEGGRKGAKVGVYHSHTITYEQPDGWNETNAPFGGYGIPGLTGEDLGIPGVEGDGSGDLNKMDMIAYDISIGGVGDADALIGAIVSTYTNFGYNPYQPGNISPASPPDGYEGDLVSTPPPEVMPTAGPGAVGTTIRTVYSHLSYFKIRVKVSYGDQSKYDGESERKARYYWGQWEVNDDADSPVANEWVWVGDAETGHWRGTGNTATLDLKVGTRVPAFVHYGDEYNEWTENRSTEAFGWEWDGHRWTSILENEGRTHHRYAGAIDEVDSQGNSRMVMKPIVHRVPAYEVYAIPESIAGLDFFNATADGNWEWNGVTWEWSGGESADEVEGSSRLTFTKQRYTYDLHQENDRGARSIMMGNSDYNEWEEKSFEFTLPEEGDPSFFEIDQPCRLYVEGQYGDFGALFVDKVKVQVRLTAAARYIIYPDAELVDLDLEISEVINNQTVRVTQTYDEAVSSQNGVLSGFVLNKYVTFTSGFNIDYKVADAYTEDVHSRYESKILAVTGQQITIDKTYMEYGQLLGAPESNWTDSSNRYWNRQYEEYFIRYMIKDPDNLYTYLVTDEDEKSLVINFKPVNVEEYPGGVAYKFLDPLPPTVDTLNYCYIVEEVTPSLTETIDLIPFVDEKISDTVLQQPNWDELETPIRERATSYKSHTDIVGVEDYVRKQLEDRFLSSSLENVNVNTDYRQYKNFSHFSSAEQRIRNFDYKFKKWELNCNASRSLGATLPIDWAVGNFNVSGGAYVSASAVDIEKYNMDARKIVNGLDDFESYMFFKSSSYVTSSIGEFFENSAPKVSGNGTLTNPYELYPATSSTYITWFNNTIETASIYDRKNSNMLVNLLPEHIRYDDANSDFLKFMNMIGHHYDIIWTYVKGLTDVHDRSEDVTEGISQALVEPVAKSLGFDMIEGRDLVRLPKYQLGLTESVPGSGVYNVRFSKKSQKEVTQEIWNRILATMPYMLKSKGTKQSLKALIATYGIPTSILRIQEYGGPTIEGKEPDYLIKQKFSKALDFKGSQYLTVPWYQTAQGRTPDVVEVRFKTPIEQDVIIADKANATATKYAALYIENDGGTDLAGKVSFVMSGSASGNVVSMSVGSNSVYNDEYWSVMVRRRKHALPSSLSSSYYDQVPGTDSILVTQSFDMFLGYYDSGTDRVIIKESASMDVSESLLTAWTKIENNQHSNWNFGGRGVQTAQGSRFTGSMMEMRYWSMPLTASAFYNHVAAPKAVNGNHVSSSYYDLSLRLSCDDNINLYSSPYGIKDYSHTDAQIIATGSGFADEINFSSVSDRQKAFVPMIGINKQSNKIRLEDAQLVYQDGLPGQLSHNRRLEKSSYDNAALDSGRLGVYLAPTDVIDEDIMLSLADMDFGSYLGDYRDTYEDKYFYGAFDNASNSYWKKWTSQYNFWDYLKLIKYYDLSLFTNLRKLSPGRAQKTIGILIENNMLERPKVVIGKKPTLEDIKKTAHIKESAAWAFMSSYTSHSVALPISESGIFSPDSVQYSELNSIITQPAVISQSVSYVEREGKLLFLEKHFIPSASDAVLRVGIKSPTGSLVSTTDDFDTTSSRTPSARVENLQPFKKDPPLVDFFERDYATGSVYTQGGSDIFFEAMQPTVTESVYSEQNKETVSFYSSNLSSSLHKAYSSSLVRSRYSSILDTCTAFRNLSYIGCLENGSTVPVGDPSAVEISETNPFVVVSSFSGDGNVTTELDGE